MTDSATYVSRHNAPEPEPQYQAARQAFGPRNRRIGLVAGTVAAVLVAGSVVASGLSVAAKSELCEMAGHSKKLYGAGRHATPVAGFGAQAKRIHTLAGRLVFFRDLAAAGEGLADAFDSMAALLGSGLLGSGYDITSVDDVDSGTAAQMNAVGFQSSPSRPRAAGVYGTNPYTHEKVSYHVTVSPSKKISVTLG